MREITQQHLELRHLQADLAVKEAFITELRQTNERAAVVKRAAVEARSPSSKWLRHSFLARRPRADSGGPRTATGAHEFGGLPARVEGNAIAQQVPAHLQDGSRCCSKRGRKPHE